LARRRERWWAGAAGRTTSGGRAPADQRTPAHLRHRLDSVRRVRDKRGPCCSRPGRSSGARDRAPTSAIATAYHRGVSRPRSRRRAAEHHPAVDDHRRDSWSLISSRWSSSRPRRGQCGRRRLGGSSSAWAGFPGPDRGGAANPICPSSPRWLMLHGRLRRPPGRPLAAWDGRPP